MGFAFEEAGAELFANRTMLELTGLSGEQWPVDEYSPLVQGVELIGQRLGRPDTLEWLLESRGERSMEDWCISQLGNISLNEKDISLIMERPNDMKQWLMQVKAILEVKD